MSQNTSNQAVANSSINNQPFTPPNRILGSNQEHYGAHFSDPIPFRSFGTGPTEPYDELDDQDTETVGTLPEDIVTLYVGYFQEPFEVHKELLMNGSEIFSEAFTPGSQVSKENVIYLPEDFPHIVKCWINFLYLGYPSLNTPAASSSTIDATDDWAHQQYRQLVLRTYFFAEKYIIKHYMNIVIDDFQEYSNRHSYTFKCQEIEQIYAATEKESQLRKMAVLSIMHNITHSVPADRHDRKWGDILVTIPDLFEDVMRFGVNYTQLTRGALDFRRRALSVYRGLPTCDFHVHAPNEECYRKSGW